MKRKLACLAFAVSVASLLAGGAAVAQSPLDPADMILTGGEVYTGDGWAQALAIRKGAIVAVGDAAAISRLRGPATKVVELKGAAVFPGLHDMHLHALNAGRLQTECLLKRGSPPAELRVTIKACADRKAPGEWITGGRWVNASFIDEVQDKRLLDEVAPNNPVILQDETAHSSWVNSAALKLAGIDRDTKNPLNGVIEHDATGEPTGMLRETAAGLVRSKVPPQTPAQMADAMEVAFKEMLTYGITSFQDAGNNETVPIFARLADEGRLKQRAKVCIRWVYNITGVDPAFEDLYARRSSFRRARVQPDCVKITLDGVPGEGHTAAMLEAYADTIPGDKDDSRKFGIMTVPPETLKRMVTRFDADGMAMLMHATGDAAGRAGMDAIAAARAANGYSGPLHQIGHNNFTTMADLKRAKSLGATLEFSAYLYYWNGVTQVYLKAIGPERFKRFKPVREAIDQGVLTLGGSDWPVSASVNPWLAIETLVTRERPGGGGDKLAPAEAITLKEAIDSFTINPARQFGHADHVGRIQPGYLADLTVLDRNPFTVPITQVHDTRARMTFVNGELTYQAP